MSYTTEHGKIFLDVARVTLGHMFDCECSGLTEVEEEPRFNTDKKVSLYILNDDKGDKIRKMAIQNTGMKSHIKYFTREAMKRFGLLRPRKLL